MFQLACGGCWSPDLSIATQLPFVFWWGILFYTWSVSAFGLNLFARSVGRPFAISPWRYLLVAFLATPPTMGILTVLFLLLPIWLFRAGVVLGSGAGGQTFRMFLRAVLAAGLVLAPMSYLRVYVDYAELYPFYPGSEIWPSVVAGLVCLAVAVLLFMAGFARGRGLGLAEALRARRRPRRPRVRPRKRTVTLQSQQGCPLCWEHFGDATDAQLSVCTGCNTVSHRGCGKEMGGCPTIGCRGSLRRRRRPPASSLDGLYVRLRPGREAIAIG